MEPYENSHANYTGAGGDVLAFSPVIEAVARVLLVVIVGLNSLGYSWIIITTVRHVQLRAVSNFFLVNLCVGELLFSTVLVPLAFAVVLLGNSDARAAESNAGIVFICVFVLSGFFLSASLWVADKNLKLFTPFLYPRLATLRYFAISLLISWGTALLVALLVFVRLVTIEPLTREAVSFPVFILQNWWVLLLIFDGVVALSVAFITLSNIAVIRLAYKQLHRISSRPAVVVTEAESQVDRKLDLVFSIQLPTELVSGTSTTEANAAVPGGGLCRPRPRSRSRRLSFIVYACTFTLAWTPAVILVNLHAFSSIAISPTVIGISGMVAVNQSAFATLVYTLKGKDYRVILARHLTRTQHRLEMKVRTMKCWKS